MIVDKNGGFKTLRNYPKMALINVKIQGDFLVLETSGKAALEVPVNPKGLSLMTCRLVKLIKLKSYYGKWIFNR